MGFTLFRCASNGIASKGSKDLLEKMRCAACPLRYSDAQHKKMPPSGTDEPILYVVGEAPGRDEDKKGEPFVGASGKMLKFALSRALADKFGFRFADVRNDVDSFAKKFCRFSNTVWTRPPKNRTPTEEEIACCRPHLEEDLISHRPNVVLAVGGTAASWFGINKGIKSVRGRPIVSQVKGRSFIVVPVYHPSFLLRNGVTVSHLTNSDDDLAIVFMRDIRWAVDLAADPPDVSMPEEIKYYLDHKRLPGTFVKIRGDEDFDRLEAALSVLRQEELVAFDIETASDEREDFRKVRPYGIGATIVSISFSNGRDFHLSVLLDHDATSWSRWRKSIVVDKLREFLSHDGNGPRFIAHNLMFELEWLWKFWRINNLPSYKWEDTYGQAFVIDPRPGTLDLDFQCRTYFGVDMKKLVPVSIKDVRMEDDQRLMAYNTLDCFFTYHLFKKQQEFIALENKQQVYRDQVERVPALMKMQAMGLIVDLKKNKEIDEQLRNEIDGILDKINSNEHVKEFNERYGTFSPSSNDDVAKVIYEIAGLEPVYTKKGNLKVDAEVLENAGLDIANLIIEYRTLLKLHSTYVRELGEGGKYLWPDGRMHPNFLHARVQTRRFSSTDPNCQNFPKRKSAYIRGQIVAPPNHYVVSVDYGQIEARVIAMVTKDSRLVRYMWDMFDIHQYWAERSAQLYPKALDIAKREVPEKEPMSGLRFIMKNRFVFPGFYGAGKRSITRNLGFPERIVDQLYEEFKDMFPGVIKWQERVRRHYKQKGYLELLSGFRRYAPVEKANAVINSPIQGTAAEIVCAALVALSERAEREEDWPLQPVLDIHDDLTFVVPKKRVDYYIDEIIQMMCLSPLEKFDWINVPIIAEVSVGHDWYKQEKIAEISSQEFGHSRIAA